jgi:hypothetical protein
MAIVQALIAFVGRSFGRILSALFDWAVLAIFGYTTGRERLLLSALLAAAGAWPILLIGVVAPKTAVFLISFIPIPAWVPSWLVRGLWIALAAIVPLAVGVAVTVRGRDRQGRRGWWMRLLSGFPITIGLSTALGITLLTVPVLRVVSAVRRRQDVQVPLVTNADTYEDVAHRIATILTKHRRPARRLPAPWWLVAPLRALKAMDAEAFEGRIPDELAYLEGSDLVLALYPSGLLIRGRPDALAAAQGLIVEGLSALEVWQTSDPRAQAIESRLSRLWPKPESRGLVQLDARRRLANLDHVVTDIEALPVAYDEWQIVYRKALQLERALRGEGQLLDGRKQEDTMEKHPDSLPRPRAVRSTNAASTPALIADAAKKLEVLARSQVHLARAEMMSQWRRGLRMAVALAVAVAAALAGLTLLLVAVALALTAYLPGWLAALCVAVVALAAGSVAALVAWRRRVRDPLALTRRTLKRNLQWLTERMI